MLSHAFYIDLQSKMPKQVESAEYMSPLCSSAGTYEYALVIDVIDTEYISFTEQLLALRMTLGDGGVNFC